MKLPLWRIAEFAAKGEVDQELAALGYSIDARALNPGDLFIALTGDRFGPDDIEAALRRGAVAPLIEAGRKIQAAPVLCFSWKPRCGRVIGVRGPARIVAEAGCGRPSSWRLQSMRVHRWLARCAWVMQSLLKPSLGEAGSVAVKDFGVQH